MAFNLDTNEAVAGALTQARVGATSTKLADGRVLVTGGAVGAGDGVVISKFADTCTFDGTPDCSAEGSLVNSRAGHCAVCRDAECNDVLLIGGLAASLRTDHCKAEAGTNMIAEKKHIVQKRFGVCSDTVTC